MTAKIRFAKAEILRAFAREDRSYRLGILCTHWIRDVERYAPNAAALARSLHMQTDSKMVSDADLAELLEDPAKRELLSSDFLLYLSPHADTRALRVAVGLLRGFRQSRARPVASQRYEIRAVVWCRLHRAERGLA